MAASPAGHPTIWQSVRGEPLTIFCVGLIGWAVSNLDQSLFGYAIPSISAEFGTALSDIGWILSASFAAAAVMTVYLGLLADRYGRKRMFVAVLSTSALLVGLQSFAPSMLVLALIRVPAFAISNGLAPIVMSYNAEAAPARFRGLMTGLINCGYPLGWFGGSMIAASLMASHGWRAIFLPALLVAPAALLLARWLPESSKFKQQQLLRLQQPPGTVDTFRSRLAILFAPHLRRRAIACMLGNFFFGGAYAGSAFYFPTFYHEVRGYTTEESAHIVGFAYGIGILGYILAAFVGEFVMTRRNTIITWFLSGGVALVCAIWLPHSFTQDVIFFGITACFFYGSSAVFGVFSAEIFPTRIRAMAMAICASFAAYAGFALFPPLVPWAVQHLGWQWAFTLISAPALVAAAIAIGQIENIASGIDIDAIRSDDARSDAVRNDVLQGDTP
jgi:MFS family permease